MNNKKLKTINFNIFIYKNLFYVINYFDYYLYSLIINNNN